MNFIQNYIKSPIYKLFDNKELSEADHILFILVSLLITIGVIFSYSLSVYTVEIFSYNQFHFILRQGLVAFLSISIIWIFTKLNPYYVISKVGMSLFAIGFLLMFIMPFLPSSFVTASGGANRWIRLPGFSLSPVEFFKVGFVYFLSWSFYRKIIHRPKVNLFGEFKMLFPYFGVFVLVVIFVAFFQKDLGQVFLLAVVMIVLTVFANRTIKILLTLCALCIFGLIALIIVAPHRINRFHSWWSMSQDTFLAFLPSDWQKIFRVENLPEPYQVSQSLNAIHNGGFFGKGVGFGEIKMGFLSEVHTDFVLAGITEEIGWIGFIFIIILFFSIIWRIFKIAKLVENKIFYLFCTSIALMIILSFFINSFGISGLIPIKGMAVPMVSYGGSSLLANAFAIGMVLCISRTVKSEKGVS
ncbi:FtsW/RodA/SpoVE family cell cycle protein [Aliarcobacter thereius]|uniref:Probable peptidoglycan glycosyltransferase FtsW n=2 Tax=Aliarcobacter thereius TaxID=544718 RepID=A0A1C0B5X9_9BACT|nr:FtsW/RodA/SpoVE family cell cycle protein [Aliarcobacter thereius]OCL89838.1 Lipid II flippase FtsW [Aliarcobacter thereius]OCL96488.1 Lipid II flippase FtsW [Aliarcobacter thereius LMG 24486]OCL98562.1 Lipid II flippase FtsW [Aliarcobacter thereius]QBF15554.1 cell division protein, FtsW/RodA/SpoVE family [Aliarcobacter thereius LMG 24486]TLS91648.1 cell division protein [Aliarcobacter thereius]